MPSKKSPQRTFVGAWLPLEAHAQLAEQAQHEERTQADIIRRALREYLRAHGPAAATKDAGTAA